MNTYTYINKKFDTFPTWKSNIIEDLQRQLSFERNKNKSLFLQISLLENELKEYKLKNDNSFKNNTVQLVNIL